MRDLLIGSLTGYSPEKIHNWVQSAKKHFTGEILVIGYNIPDNTLQYLKDNNVSVVLTQPLGLHIVVQRFLDIFNYLTQNPDYRFIICTDIKDVIFQRNPSEFLEKKLTNKHLLVGSEGIKYKDESWNVSNLATCYPYLTELQQDNIVYNAGTFAGKTEYIKDFCFNIFHLSLTAVHNDPQPDQAAFNILLNTQTLKDITYYSKLDEPWCAQLGITLVPELQIKYQNKFIDNLPEYKNNQVLTFSNELYYLVHQYDRIPSLDIKYL
jgi:hypothetical protein